MSNLGLHNRPYVPGTFNPAKLALIPCPNLRTLVNEGWLTPDKDGLVDLKQLEVALTRLGIQGLPKKVLVGGAQKATADAVAEQFGAFGSGKFNIYKLVGSNLDHPGDTQILRGGFNKERLDWLMGFANADGRTGMKEVSKAQKVARNLEKTSFRDKMLGIAELTALVKVYATPDQNDGKSISVDGVRSLYEQSRFPDEWRARLVPDAKLGSVSPQKTALFRLIGGVVEMAFRQVGTTTGRAYQGLALSTGKELPLSDTAATGLGKSMCPLGPPPTTMKGDARNAHMS